MFPYRENKIQIFVMFNRTMHVKIMSGRFTKTTVIVSYKWYLTMPLHSAFKPGCLIGSVRHHHNADILIELQADITIEPLQHLSKLSENV